MLNINIIISITMYRIILLLNKYCYIPTNTYHKYTKFNRSEYHQTNSGSLILKLKKLDLHVYSTSVVDKLYKIKLILVCICENLATIELNYFRTTPIYMVL